MSKKLTPAQQAFRKRLLGDIHSAQIYIDIYKDDRKLYEAMLQKTFSKRSSKDLSINQLLCLRDYLRGKSSSPIETITPKQITYIQSMWKKKARNTKDDALLVFANKISGKTLIGLHALNRSQANGVIAAIHNMESYYVVS